MCDHLEETLPVRYQYYHDSTEAERGGLQNEAQAANIKI
jgi:hypothetical protein